MLLKILMPMQFVETILCYALFITSITTAQAQSYSWQELPGPKLPVTALESVGDQLYAGLLGYGVYRSDDEGMTWKEMNTGMLDGIIFDILAVSETEIYIASFLSGVLYTKDGGENWLPFNKGITADRTYCLLKRGNRLFTGTSRGVYSIDVTKDTVWRHATFPFYAPSLLVQSLYQTEDALYAGSSQSIYISKDEGQTWREIPKLTHAQVFTMAEYKGKLFLGTSGEGLLEMDFKTEKATKSTEFFGNPQVPIIMALYVTSDSVLLKATHNYGIFQNDSTMNRGLTSFEVRAIHEYKNQIYIGTYGRGVLVFKEDKVTDVANPKTQQEALQLEISPNPSTHFAQINLWVKGEEAQRLKGTLLSPDGRLVKTFMTAAKYSPGRYTFNLDVQELPAGVYYAYLSNEAGILGAVQKLVISR